MDDSWATAVGGRAVVGTSVTVDVVGGSVGLVDVTVLVGAVDVVDVVGANVGAADS